jgi:plastocyanin
LHINLLKCGCVLLLFLQASPVDAQEKPGGVFGTVRFLGAVPPDQKIMTTDGGTILHNDLVVDPRTKGLRHVVVALEKAPDAHKAPPRKDKAIMDQRDMLFLPRVIAIQEGQTVHFENNDLCNHGVRANSTLKANTFNVNTPPGQPFDFEFKTQKNPVIIDCPIHAWMKAYLFAFDHPFFAVTDAAGAFRISNVPPGKHNLVIRHADTGAREVRPIIVEAGKDVTINIDWMKTGGTK